MYSVYLSYDSLTSCSMLLTKVKNLSHNGFAQKDTLYQNTFNQNIVR